MSTLFKHLWSFDLRLVARDRFLIFIPGYLLVIVGAMRWGIPPLSAWLLRTEAFDLRPYWILLGSYVAILLSAMFVGVLVGFLLLDEAEQGTLRARLVMPLPLNRYLAYRVGVPALFGAVILPLIALGHGLGAPSVGVLLFLAVANGPMAVVSALFFPLVARDKVQAFAWAKLLSGLCVVPLVAVLLDAPWNVLVGGWLPPYWTVEAYVRASQGSPWLLHGASGAVTSWALAYGLLRLYARSVRRA